MTSDLAGSFWLLAIIGGPAVMALVFIYGMIKVRRRRSKVVADTATVETRQLRAGTRRVMMWAVGLGAALFIAIMLWPLVPNHGMPANGDREQVAKTCSDRPQATVRNCATPPKAQTRS